MWAVVGLGNPGRKYANTRHNAGFIFVENMAKRWSVRLKKKKYLSKSAHVKTNYGSLLLVKPWTYMNGSGLAVRELLRMTGIKLDHLLVAYDDLDISLGEIRIRKTGGAGTHNGMSSIIREIESTLFPRLRIGIGPLPPGAEATDFVLSDFLASEKPGLEESLAKAEETVALVLNGEIGQAMNKFNRRPRDANPRNFDKEP